jgi:GT2 family glycosyltransferase
VILNNDVLIPQGWLAGLLGFAEEQRIDVVSPAICEGVMDYDFPFYAQQFMQRMARAKRHGTAYGPCFMVRRKVFDTAGLFDDDIRLGGYEDDEFFRRSRQKGFQLAVTGRSFLHHFGSVTQKAIKAAMNQPKASLGDRAYYREKYKLNWFRRQRSRLYNRARANFWRLSERWRYRYTLVSRRQNGAFIWR